MNYLWSNDQKGIAFGTKNISYGWDTYGISTVGQGSNLELNCKS